MNRIGTGDNSPRDTFFIGSGDVMGTHIYCFASNENISKIA
jgi:hypothetical protein